MNLNEAKQLLKKNGYLLEFRDASQEIGTVEKIDDSETDFIDYCDNHKVGRSWDNIKVNGNKVNNKEYHYQKIMLTNHTNELIKKIDEVVNRFEDYDYFVKRYDYQTISIRKTDNGILKGPYLAITVYCTVAGDFYYSCFVGRCDRELAEKYKKDNYSEESLLNWVSNCLADGVLTNDDFGSLSDIIKH